MIKKLLKYGKIVIAMTLIGALTLPSYATVGASDGSAFVTKAEFDAALSDFNARLTTFEAGINSKIDSQVSSYLDRNGIWNGKEQQMDGWFNNGGKWFSLNHWGESGSAMTWNTTDDRRINKVMYIPELILDKDPETGWLPSGTTYGFNARAVPSTASLYTYRWIVPTKAKQYNTQLFIPEITKSGLLMFQCAIRADFCYTGSRENYRAYANQETWSDLWHTRQRSAVSGTAQDLTMNDLLKLVPPDNTNGTNLIMFTLSNIMAIGYRVGGIQIGFDMCRKEDDGSFNSLTTLKDYQVNWPNVINAYSSGGFTYCQCSIDTYIVSVTAFVKKGDQIWMRGDCHSYGRTANQQFGFAFTNNADDLWDENGNGSSTPGYWRALILPDKPSVY